MIPGVQHFLVSQGLQDFEDFVFVPFDVGRLLPNQSVPFVKDKDMRGIVDMHGPFKICIRIQEYGKFPTLPMCERSYTG